MKSNKTQQGFSAIELLITLFIGALFLFAGYQLYSYVTQSGLEASRQSLASSLAYQYLRQYQNTNASSSCTLSSSSSCTTTFSNVTPPSNSGLSNITITIVQQLNSSVSNIVQTQVTISYFDTYSQKTLSHGIYATLS